MLSLLNVTRYFLLLILHQQYDQRAQAAGKPTSDEVKKAEALEKFKKMASQSFHDPVLQSERSIREPRAD